jgi:hypothetical protein
VLTVSAESQLKKLSNNNIELGKRFDPTSAYCADHLSKISEVIMYRNRTHGFELLLAFKKS